MRRITASNGVVYYRSEMIPCMNGFSTRIGGVSQLTHTASLNLGMERGDPKETVFENLSRFGKALGFDAQDVISVSQIHSTSIRFVTLDHKGEGFFRPQGQSCDGYVTNQQGIVLGVRTADCVPILLYAPSNKTGFSGAVAAVHAGWRGTAGKIVCKAVDYLCELGADLNTICAAIGPAIGRCCYEVRKDFYDAFQSSVGSELTEKYVLPHSNKDNIWMADLQGVNEELLLRYGIKKDRIDLCQICTCCHPEEFYSHRHSHGMRGTMLSVISLSPSFHPFHLWE
ncbi:MAG: peptidoglycan editing factor PgeF [Clostridia bacterium]|nr:peptidoglycan editing factor PgeF [Clostridia bacterium]